MVAEGGGAAAEGAEPPKPARVGYAPLSIGDHRRRVRPVVMLLEQILPFRNI